MKNISSFMSRNLLMEKHAIPSSVPLGVSNKTPMKRSKNRNKKHPKKDLILNKLVSYLTSDSHMYNPLVSSQPSLDCPPPNQMISTSSGIEEDVALPTKGSKKNLFDKVVEFLEADCYMYSPLIADEHVGSKNHTTVKSSGGQMQKGAVQEDGDLSRQLRARQVVKKTVAYHESVKHMHG